MRYLAFDPSPTATGIAFWDGKSPAPVLSRTTAVGWDRSAGEMIENCRKFYGKLFSDLKPDVAAIEMGIMGGHSDGLTIARQAQLAGQVMWVAYMKGVPCWEIPQGTWRKSFIGWGTPKKGQTETMKALAVRRCLELGWDYHRDHNEAESGGILDHLITCIQGETPPWRLPRPSALPPEDDVALPF